MNPRTESSRLPFIRPALAACLTALSCAWLGACIFQSKDDPHGTEVENEAGYGRIVLPGGKPAAEAVVRIVPVGYLPKAGLPKAAAAGIIKVATDADGRYEVKSVPAGDYNILAAQGELVSFQDSVSLNQGPTSLRTDTLTSSVSLAGVVALEPNHNPASASVQVLGTTFFGNVESGGRFRLDGLAPGKYMLMVSTTIAGYNPLYRSIEILGDTLLPDTLRPIFTDIPIATGAKLIAYDTLAGVATLGWHASPYRDLLGYGLFRDTANSLEVGQILRNAHRITDTLFYDTVYAPGRTYGLQIQEWEYRPVVQGKTGRYGETFESVSLRAPSPAYVATALAFQAVGGRDGQFTPFDTLRIVAQFSNPTRKVDSLAWTVDGRAARAVRIAPASSGTDTLVWVAGATAARPAFTLVAYDDAGSPWMGFLQAQVLLDAPRADAGRDTACRIAHDCALTGRASDGLGRIVSMEWDLGGTGTFRPTADGKAVLRMPASPGAPVVAVFRATDDDGLSTLDTVRVSIIVDPPRADAGRDTACLAGSDCLLTGRASDGLGSIVKLEWDLGGGFRASDDGTATLHMPGAVGKVTAAVFRATDDDGNTTSDTVLVTGVAYTLSPERPIPACGRVDENSIIALPLAHANGKVYAFGSRGSTYEKTAWTEYDPSTRAWTIKGNAPYPGHIANIGDRIFLFNNDALSEYDPGTDAWMARSQPYYATTLPIPFHVNGDFLAVIGNARANQDHFLGIYDAGTGQWRKKSDLSNPTAITSLSPTSDFVLQGDKAYFLNVTSPRWLWEYDYGADLWRELPGRSVSTDISFVGAADSVLVASSASPQGDMCETFDLRTQSWSRPFPMPFRYSRNPFSENLQTFERNGKLLIISNGYYAIPSVPGILLFEFDPATSTFRTLPPVPVTNDAEQGATLIGDVLYIAPSPGPTEEVKVRMIEYHLDLAEAAP